MEKYQVVNLNNEFIKEVEFPEGAIIPDMIELDGKLYQRYGYSFIEEVSIFGGLDN